MSSEQTIRLEVSPNGVATIWLNRPDKYNAFNRQMIREWHEALVRCADDPAISVVVMTGAGRAFCAGGDAGTMDERRSDSSLDQKDYLWRHIHKIAFELERLDKPVIGAINGLARGAGVDMSLMCDIRIAAESATFAESYINLGLIAGDGGAYWLPRLVGIDRALMLLWTGETIDAREAERIGLVTAVRPDAELLDYVYSLAAKLASQPAPAIRMVKRAVYQGLHMSFAAHLDTVSSHMAVLRGTAEHKQKVATFLQRKKDESKSSDA